MNRLNSIFGLPGSGKSYSMKTNVKWLPMKEIREIYGPRATINLIGVDEAQSWTPYNWHTLRRALMKGKWVTEKKEKKIMFGWKKTIIGIKMKLDEVYSLVLGKDGDGYSARWSLKSRVNELEEEKTEYIDCHTCGCVVRREIAFRGRDRIEREEVFNPANFSGFTFGVGSATVTNTDEPQFMEETRETWYCKLHKRGKKAYGSK